MSKNTQLAKAETNAFMVEKVDQDSGEVTLVPEFKYLEGNPREYKSDAKDGNFLLGGKVIGQALSLQPVASRFFEEDLFNLGMRSWVELFFLDEKNVLSAILFHGFSAEALTEMASPLYYDDLKLSDVVLHITWKQLVNEKTKPKSTYCVAEFSYEEADSERTKYVKNWVKTQKVYRKATIKDTTENKTSENYYNPFDHTDPALLSE